LREVKAFEDSVGVQLEAGAHAVEENVGRSAAVTESKLRELADAQVRPATRPQFQTAARQRRRKASRKAVSGR
jgi:hypothetical protein